MPTRQDKTRQDKTRQDSSISKSVGCENTVEDSLFRTGDCTDTMQRNGSRQYSTVHCASNTFRKMLQDGVDLTFVNPTIMEVQSCMAARYDAGIVKHQKEHTGVIEIWKLQKESV